MIAIESHAEGIVIRLKVRAGARTSGIVGEHDGALKIAVAQAPERGKANRAVVEVLARELQLRKSQIEILHGETSTQKQLLIRNAAKAELLAKIANILASLEGE